VKAAEQPSPAVLRIELQASHAGLQVRILKSRGGRPVCVQLGHLGAPRQFQPQFRQPAQFAR